MVEKGFKDGVSKLVRWCFTPSQPVRLYQGDKGWREKGNIWRENCPLRESNPLRRSAGAAPKLTGLPVFCPLRPSCPSCWPRWPCLPRCRTGASWRRSHPLSPDRCSYLRRIGKICQLFIVRNKVSMSCQSHRVRSVWGCCCSVP